MSRSPLQEDRCLQEQPGTITQLLARTAAEHPARPALQMWRGDRWESWTYRQLLQTSQRLAALLLEEGLEPGDRVILLAESQPAWVIAYLSASAAGLTVVPMDPQTRPQEVIAAAEFTEARRIFVSNWTAEALEAALPREGRPPPCSNRAVGR